MVDALRDQFVWLESRFPQAIIPFIPHQCRHQSSPSLGRGRLCSPGSSQVNGDTSLGFDNLYIDLRSTFFDLKAAAGVGLLTEEGIIDELLQFIDTTVCLINPRRLVYLATDGVVSKATLNTNLGHSSVKVRPKGVKAASVSGFLKKKAPASYKTRSMHPQSTFDASLFLPGSVFMNKLNKALEKFLSRKRPVAANWGKVDYVIAGTNTPDEGKCKIVNKIRSYHPNVLLSHEALSECPTHLVVSEDLELITHLLGTKIQKCYILRQSNGALQTKVTHQLKYQLSPTPFLALGEFYDVVNCSVLSQSLVEEMSPANLPFTINDDDVINDYTLLSLLQGNDFIPRIIPNTNIKFSTLVRRWKDSLHDMGGNIVTTLGRINLGRFKIFLTRLMEACDSETGPPLPYLQSAAPGSLASLNKVDGGRELISSTGDAVCISELAENYLQGLNWALLYALGGSPPWDGCYGSGRTAPTIAEILNLNDTKSNSVPGDTVCPITIQPTGPPLPKITKDILLPQYQPIITAHKPPVDSYFPSMPHPGSVPIEQYKYASNIPKLDPTKQHQTSTNESTLERLQNEHPLVQAAKKVRTRASPLKLSSIINPSTTDSNETFINNWGNFRPKHKLTLSSSAHSLTKIEMPEKIELSKKGNSDLYSIEMLIGQTDKEQPLPFSLYPPYSELDQEKYSMSLTKSEVDSEGRDTMYNSSQGELPPLPPPPAQVLFS